MAGLDSQAAAPSRSPRFVHERSPLAAAPRTPRPFGTKDFKRCFTRIARGETVWLARGEAFTCEPETFVGWARAAGAADAGVRVSTRRRDEREWVVLFPGDASPPPVQRAAGQSLESRYDFPGWFARVAAGETVWLERGREFTAKRGSVRGLAHKAGAKAAGVRVELPRDEPGAVLLVPAGAPRAPRASKYDFPGWFVRVAAGETVRLERGREFTVKRESVSGLAYKAGAKAAGVRVSLPRDDEEAVLLHPRELD